MLRKLCIGLCLIVGFLFQVTLFQGLSLASTKPNLILILVFTFGIMRGKKTGIWTGFFGGLLLDIYYGDSIGFYAMIYMYIGYLNGVFYKLFYDEDITLPLLLIFMSNLLYGFSIYVIRFLLRGRLDIVYYFQHVVVAETIYTMVVAIIIYRPLLWMNRVLEKIEKRSAGKFG